MKKITILGSTGSIGVTTLRVIKNNPEKYKVIALGAGKNIELLAEQIETFHPKAVAVLDENLALMLKKRLNPNRIPDILFGSKGYERLATMDEIDTLISAMTGAAGLLPTYAGICAAKNIALANKETMVMAGPLVMNKAKEMGVSVLPIDSEHSAILQSLQGHPRKDLSRVILTASGGPFRDQSLNDMVSVTPAQALEHPNWSMGKKISIDSATMMNKGFEAIEAKWFFDLEMEQISILIHPQSIIHSMVEYTDGSVIAQLGIPDMMLPISYALSFPRHLKNDLPPVDLDQIGSLTFKRPDMEIFPCLALALQAAKHGGTMPVVLNGANEIAVESFLNENIRFLDIPNVISKTMASHKIVSLDSIDTVLEADSWARKYALKFIKDL